MNKKEKKIKKKEKRQAQVFFFFSNWNDTNLKNFIAKRRHYYKLFTNVQICDDKAKKRKKEEATKNAMAKIYFVLSVQ